MSIKKLSSLLSISIILSLSFSCRPKEENELAHQHEHAHGHEHGNGHEHAHGNNNVSSEAIEIEPDRAEALGIKSKKVEPADFNAVIKVGGELSAPNTSRSTIVATSPGILQLGNDVKLGMQVSKGQSLGIISGNEVAGGDTREALRIEFESNKKELERITPLYEKGIVSKKDYNAALSAYEKSRNAMGGNSKNVGTVKANSSGTLITLDVNNGEYVEAGQTIGIIGDNSTLTLKAAVPKKYHSKIADITDAFIIPSCGDCDGFYISGQNGKKLTGESTSQNKVSGFLPVYFTFNNNGHIDGSGYVETYLKLSETHNAIAVPNAALFEQMGQWFVFVQLDEDCYEKRPVKRGGNSGESTEIIQGLHPGESVVVEGVTYLKLAENAGVVPEGHSHSH